MIKVNKFGSNITTSDVGEEMFDEIRKKIDNQNSVILDFENVITMTTFCAKQVFGQLYNDYGAEKFNRSIKFKNISEELQAIIIHGIESD